MDCRSEARPSDTPVPGHPGAGAGIGVDGASEGGDQSLDGGCTVRDVQTTRPAPPPGPQGCVRLQYSSRWTCRSMSRSGEQHLTVGPSGRWATVPKVSSDRKWDGSYSVYAASHESDEGDRTLRRWDSRPGCTGSRPDPAVVVASLRWLRGEPKRRHRSTAAPVPDGDPGNRPGRPSPVRDARRTTGTHRARPIASRPRTRWVWRDGLSL